MSKEKLWAGRFNEETHHLVDQFNASITFDARLAKADIIGSLAHASMLGHCNIISTDDAQEIKSGLKALLQKCENNSLSYRVEDEDIHMNIEQLLHKEIGANAGKLHTGRSRNDQVATDLHLFLRQEVLLILDKIHAMQSALLEQAEKHVDTLMPGYTHLQRAQPVRLAHHLLAYVAMLQRDAERLIDSWPRINSMPLGSGALAGSGFPIDRDYLADALGFEHLYINSMDAVSDRDFVIEFISNASTLMMHLSRLSEEFILWASQEFSFIELDDAFCTGSSMLPHKKNPDIPELVRGKTGRVYGALFSILTTLKGLPLSYNKDLQEDKEGLFDVVDTIKNCLEIYQALIKQTHFNEETLLKAVTEDYSGAIAIANYLCGKGIPFRQAHKICGQIVMHCLSDQIPLTDLPLDVYQQYEPAFDQSVYDVLKPQALVESQQSFGGTNKASVVKQINIAESALKDLSNWFTGKQSLLLEKEESLLNI